jgi:hypothetical protein
MLSSHVSYMSTGTASVCRNEWNLGRLLLGLVFGFVDSLLVIPSPRTQYKHDAACVPPTGLVVTVIVNLQGRGVSQPISKHRTTLLTSSRPAIYSSCVQLPKALAAMLVGTKFTVRSLQSTIMNVLWQIHDTTRLEVSSQYTV